MTTSPRRPVGVQPPLRHAGRLLVVAVPWGLVVLGRGVCLVAQRVPPLVLLVRGVRRRLDERRVRATDR